MKRAFLEIDFLLASFLLLVMVMLISQLVEQELVEGDYSKKIRRLELNALKASEFLVGKCESNVKNCQKILEKLNSTAKNLVLEDWVQAGPPPKSEEQEQLTACIQRIVVSRGRELVLEVCSK